MKKVYVIGHRNPDTDSICSAIAYANLKNQVEGNGYEAYRAGNINGETRYVLDTFGIKDPKYVSDVRPRLKDVNLNLVKGAKATDSLKSAREMMQTEKIVSLPVCLPDAAAIEAVELVENDKVKIIDTSTAHRTLFDWAYGFAELSEEFRNKIKRAVLPEDICLCNYLMYAAAVLGEVICVILMILLNFIG